jgi:hypothetical protein
MATQTVEFFAAPGQTVTAKLFSAGSDTVVASVTATEQTNRKGVYRAVYTDVAADLYRLLALVSTTPIATWWTDLTLTTATFQTYEVPTSVFAGGVGGTDWTANERTAIRSILGFDSSGTVSLPTVGVIDAIKDKTDLITSGSISVIEDRVNNDTITMQYNESTTATVNLDENTTSATLQFVVSRPDGTDILTIANASITRTSTSFTVTITTAVTATLGQYLWSLRDITGGANRVVTKGVLTVQNAASV